MRAGAKTPDNEDYERFKGLAKIFETYDAQYGIDYVMVAAQEIGSETVQYVSNILK